MSYVRDHIVVIPVGARRYPMNHFGLLLAIALLLFTGTAEASQQGITVLNNWKAADKCAKQAQAAYPDYTQRRMPNAIPS